MYPQMLLIVTCLEVGKSVSDFRSVQCKGSVIDQRVRSRPRLTPTPKSWERVLITVTGWEQSEEESCRSWGSPGGG